jgi:hypothetical protein
MVSTQYLRQIRLKREQVPSEHYRITRDFLLRPERMLKILLDRSPDRDDDEDRGLRKVSAVADDQGSSSTSWRT